MQKNALLTEKNNPKGRSQPLWALLFLIAGIYGILQFLENIEGIVFTGYVIYLAAALLCAVFWYVFFYSRKLFCLLMAGIGLIFCVACLVIRDVLWEQILQIQECILGRADLGAVPVTEAVLLLTVLLSGSFFILELILQCHVVLYLVTTGLLLLLPLFGIRPGSLTVVLLLFFQILFLAVHAARRKAASLSLRSKSIRMAAVIAAGCLLAAFPLAVYCEQELYGIVFSAEGTVYRIVSRWSGSADDLSEDGQIHTGNHYDTGTGHLELTVSDKPTEDLYLRGFEGSTYTGGRWAICEEDILFEHMAENMNWQEWRDMISGLYHNLFFEMNRHVQREEPVKPFVLTIRHLNGDYKNIYEPYYSRRQRGQRSIEDRSQTDGYVYLYFEQSDMNIEWDNILPEFERSKEWNLEIRDAYMDEIQTAYTQVPTEELPRLSKFAEEHPMDGPDEISAFILYTLHSNASYSLTPGWIPFQEDIAEYFLFKSGRGYCEHFALTAALLYRLYGVPARYVSGYKVSPDDFWQQQDGTYRTVATDECAHAWTEIFLEDYGWTPVEVTPAADGTAAAGYPGFGSREFQNIVALKNWDMNMPNLSDSAALSENAEHAARWDTKRWEIDLEKYNKVWWALGICLLYTLFLLPVLLDYRRLRHLEKTGSLNCRRMFSQLLEMLHFAGYLPECDGSEEDFASRFAAEIQSVPEEDIRCVQKIVLEAAYGMESPAMEKKVFVRSVYFCTGKEIYKKLTWNQRLVFRYWKMFG